MSDEDGKDGELDDNTAETTSLDPLDAAQVDNVLPGEQLLESSSLEQETPVGRQVLGQEKVAVPRVLLLHVLMVLSAASPTMSISNTDTHATRVHSELTSMRQCKVCSSSNTRKRTKYGCNSCAEGIHLCPVPCFGIYNTRA